MLVVYLLTFSLSLLFPPVSCVCLFPQDYCYHNGMHFLNAHAAFDLWVEHNLQKIDPKVSLALWDFMLDGARFGTDWGSSEVFGPDMFGSALGSPDNQYQISEGWFAGIQSIFDKDDELLREDAAISTNHNPYGLVDSTANYQVCTYNVLFAPVGTGVGFLLGASTQFVRLLKWPVFLWGSA